MNLFDGAAGTLSDIFGAPVTYTPPGGQAQIVQAVFRRAPVEIIGADGHPIWIMAPTLRVRRDVLPGIARGDLVQPSIDSGVTYRVVDRQRTVSAASDGFIVCELEEVTP